MLGQMLTAPWLVLRFVLAIGLLAVPPTVAAQPAKVYRVGYLSSLSAAAGERFLEAFKQGLRDLGYAEGRNIVIDGRWADGEYHRLPGLVKELVGLDPDVIFSTGGPPAARAVKAATATIPIVFVSGRAVAEGLVASLARPGGNLTGFDVLAEDLDAKRLELLKEVLPKLARVAVLWNSGTPESLVQRSVLESVAPAVGAKLLFVEAQQPGDLEKAFAAMARERPDALLVTAAPMFMDAGRRIIALAAQARLPTVYFARSFAEGGGLMSYGTDFATIYRRAATYVDRILKGARPADLPVQQPTTFELVVNARTAGALGLTIPPSVLGRVDQLVQ